MWTVGHSRRVAELAGASAVTAGLGAADVLLLRRAALVHDIGRVAVPVNVWANPGPLTRGEREQLRLHAYCSERVLDAAAGSARRVEDMGVGVAGGRWRQRRGPASSAALAISAPMPRPAPVMSQTFFSVMRLHFLLVDLACGTPRHRRCTFYGTSQRGQVGDTVFTISTSVAS